MVNTESFRARLDSEMEGFKANLVELHELAVQRSVQWAEDAVHAARTQAFQEVCELRLENDRLRECLSAATSRSSATSKSLPPVGPDDWTQLRLESAQTEEDREKAFLAAGAKALVNSVVQRALRGLLSPSLELAPLADHANFSPPPRAPGSAPARTSGNRTSPASSDTDSIVREDLFGTSSSSSDVGAEAARRAKALGFLEGWHARVDLEGTRAARADAELQPGRAQQPDASSTSSEAEALAEDSWTLKSASETALATAGGAAFGFLESLGVADSLSDSWKAWGFQGNEQKETQRRSSEPALLGPLPVRGHSSSRSHSVGYCEDSASALRAAVGSSGSQRRRKSAKGSDKLADEEKCEAKLPAPTNDTDSAQSNLEGSPEQGGKRVRFSSEVEIHPIRRWQQAAHAVTQHRRAAAAASASAASSNSSIGASLMDLLTASSQVPSDPPEDDGLDGQ